MPKKPSPKPVEELTYEMALEELEGIVTILEGGQKPLEEALSLFERGQALIRHCAALLDQAEVKVKQLTGDKLVDFNLEE